MLSSAMRQPFIQLAPYTPDSQHNSYSSAGSINTTSGNLYTQSRSEPGSHLPGGGVGRRLRLSRLMNAEAVLSKFSGFTCFRCFESTL